MKQADMQGMLLEAKAVFDAAEKEQPPAADPLALVVPLQKLLAAHGVNAGLWALVEACGEDLSIHGFATCARQHGLETQIYQLQHGDFSFLSSGALVELEGKTFATVIDHQANGIVLENADGARDLVGSKSNVKPVMALDVREASLETERLLARLGTRLKREPHAMRGVLVAGILALVMMGTSLASPIIMHAVIGHAIPGRAPNELKLLALAFSLLGVVGAYIGWLRRRSLLYLSSKLSEIASIDMVAHALSLPFAKLRSLDVGGADQAVRSATTAAEALPALVPQVLDAVLGSALLLYVFTLNPTSAAVALGGGLLVILIGLSSAKRRLTMRRELLRLIRSEEQGLYEMLVGIETVKSESIEGRMLARWLDRLLLEEKAARDLGLQASTLSTMLMVIDRAVFGAVLLLTADRCISGEASVADLVATIQATFGFMSSAQKLAQLPLAIVNFRTDLERADELLGLPSEKKGFARRPADTTAPAIVLRDVWFRYEEDAPWVIRGMDLVVRPDEVVMLTWPSGAGKSTLLRIISGLLAPTRGDAILYGVEATQARRMVCYIPQQATLFPGSLLESLQILSQCTRPDRILQAAKATGLLELVSSWPMGLDTLLSHGAPNVSSGQKQLILYTAAVASEAPIVLLDEALAHVDVSMRSRLGSQNLFRGRTVVSVVHDASPREISHARVVPIGAGDGAAALPPS